MKFVTKLSFNYSKKHKTEPFYTRAKSVSPPMPWFFLSTICINNFYPPPMAANLHQQPPNSFFYINSHSPLCYGIRFFVFQYQSTFPPLPWFLPKQNKSNGATSKPEYHRKCFVQLFLARLLPLNFFWRACSPPVRRDSSPADLGFSYSHKFEGLAVEHRQTQNIRPRIDQHDRLGKW